MPVPLIYGLVAVAVSAVAGWWYGSSQDDKKEPTTGQQFMTVALWVIGCTVGLNVFLSWKKRTG